MENPYVVQKSTQSQPTAMAPQPLRAGPCPASRGARAVGVKCSQLDKELLLFRLESYIFDKKNHFYQIYMCLWAKFTQMGDVQSRVRRLKFNQLLSQCDKSKICQAKGGLH
jgi:hypothetical protein